MNPATPQLRNFARRVLTLEAAAGKPNDAESPAIFLVCEKLRRPLSRLTGVAGFRSLLSRALALAGDEVRWLRAIHVKSDGSLEGLDEVEARLSKIEMAKGEVTLIAQLIGLLVTFIGEPLTLRLVQEAWPEVSSDDLNFETEKSDG